jgi:hypothetical protein
VQQGVHQGVRQAVHWTCISYAWGYGRMLASCAVCLEEFVGGAEQEALPRLHQFHKGCMDRCVVAWWPREYGVLTGYLRGAGCASGFWVSAVGELSCAVCLEEFVEGAELRALPCLHKFHKGCIDRCVLGGWGRVFLGTGYCASGRASGRGTVLGS